MPQIFDERYKPIVAKIKTYNLTELQKATMLLEELDTLPNDNGTMCYGTMAKAFFDLLEKENTDE